MTADFALSPLSYVPNSAIESLLDAAFGTDRHSRTAYQLRTGVAWIPALSFAAHGRDGGLLGLVQCWPVMLACDDGAHHDLIMVGPVAVHPDAQGRGIGLALMDQTMAVAAENYPLTPMMMIGDYDYYRRWDFDAKSTQGWRLNGPFAPDRLLMRNAGVLSGGVAGEVAPRR
jgi:predicted N-acetyltransferase YhbS